MVNLCRVCLNFLTEGNEYFLLNTVVLNTGYTPYREKLTACIPEMSLDAVSDAIICVPCAANLESAYEFRNKCLETEVRIQSFMQEKTPGLSTISFDDTFLHYLGFNFVVEDNEEEVNEIKIEDDEEIITAHEIDGTDEIVFSSDSREGEVIIDDDTIEEIYEEENTDDLETTVQLIECVSCSKKFTSLMQFNVHQLSEHSNSNLYTCTFCNRPFNSNMGLERHMKNSHKEYTCTVCCEEFDNKVKFNKHLRTQHGIAHNGFPVKSPKSLTGSPVIKHKRENLPKQAKKIMYKWLLENCQHPYPTDGQKKELVEQTNLTLLQVTNWFINARRRILQPLLEKCGGLIDVEAELPDD